MILLDTHVAVWAAIEPSRLSRRALSTLRRARSGTGMALAAISLWEMALLFARGLSIYGTVEKSVQQVSDTLGLVVKPLTPEIAVLAAFFPETYPRDPADRLIGATAKAEGLALVT
jgi:PIN domain nuclease of toxin-antitoxin system